MENVIKQAQGLFETNPHLSALYSTQDGQLFFQQCHAIDHNNSRVKGKITVHTRESVANVLKEKENPVPDGQKPGAGEGAGTTEQDSTDASETETVAKTGKKNINKK